MKRSPMKKSFATFLRTAAAAAVVVTVAGCSDMNHQQERMLSGGAIGAGVGAVGSAMTGGSPVGGALIGGAVGTGAGYLYDKDQKQKGR